MGFVAFSGRGTSGLFCTGQGTSAFLHAEHQFGYRLVGCELTGINAFFTPEDLVADLFATLFSTAKHDEPIRYTVAHRVGHRRAILDGIAG